MPLFKKSNFSIGLDISDLSLKLVQFRKAGKKFKIQALSKYDLPEGLIENGEIKNISKVAEAINKLLNNPKYGAVTSKDVVACLPETKTFIKLIEVENSPNNISNVINSEIEKYIPMSVKDMFFDWQIVSQNSEKYKILIGAAPRYIVDQYIGLLNSTKLTISALEIEASAISRNLLAEETPKFKHGANNNYCIIDIGAKRTSMIIYAKNTIVMTMSLPISGNETTRNIAENLEINNEQAEKAKIICGLDKTKAQGIINNILSVMIKELSGKILEIIEYYTTHYPHLGPINKIILCGGGSNINNLNQLIQETTSIETTKGNNFTNIGNIKDKILNNFTETHKIDLKLIKNKKSKNLSLKQNSILSYTTAFGLALRDAFIND